MNNPERTDSKRAFKAIAKLRKLLAEMEVELGLSRLSASERDLLYAFLCESSDSSRVVTTNDVRSNPILQDMSDPSMYRHIASLVEKGALSLAPGRSRGAYIVTASTIDDAD